MSRPPVMLSASIRQQWVEKREGQKMLADRSNISYYDESGSLIRRIDNVRTVTAQRVVREFYLDDESQENIVVIDCLRLPMESKQSKLFQFWEARAYLPPRRKKPR